MPIVATKNSDGTVASGCINCEGQTLNVPLARFTLRADDGFGEGGEIKVFVATCNSCGYIELYRDGFILNSNQGDA